MTNNNEKSCSKNRCKTCKFGVATMIVIFIALVSFGNFSASNGYFIDKHIRENPRLLVDTLNAYQTQIAIFLQLKTDPSSIVLHEGGDRSKTVIDFFDYNCKNCKKAFVTMDNFAQKHKDVTNILVNYPIFGENSTQLAKLSIAVNHLNSSKFKEFHSYLMNGNFSPEDAIAKAATILGISKEEIKTNMDSDKVKQILTMNQEMGRAINFSSVPSYLICGEIASGKLSEEKLEKLIGRYCLNN